MAAFLTEGASATVRWKSLMRLLDIHPPPKLNVNRFFFRIFLFSSVFSPSPPCRTTTGPARLRNWAMGRRSPKEEPSTVSGMQCAKIRSEENKRNKSRIYGGGVERRLGTTTFTQSSLLVKTVFIKTSMEFDFPGVQCMFGHPHRQFHHSDR